MTAVQLISELKEHGIELRPNGDSLLVSPPGSLSVELREQVTMLKGELVRALTARTEACVAPTDVEASERLVRALGAEVETPVGRGRLVYLTPHGAVVQVASGLMYTLDPRRVKKGKDSGGVNKQV